MINTYTGGKSKYKNSIHEQSWLNDSLNISDVAPAFQNDMLLTKSLEATNSSNLKEATQAFTAEYMKGESSIMNSVNHLNSQSRDTSGEMMAGFHNISINRGFTTIDNIAQDDSNRNIMLSDNIDDLPDIVHRTQNKNVTVFP